MDSIKQVQVDSDTIDARFLELALFNDGMAVFFKDEVMGYLGELIHFVNLGMSFILFVYFFIYLIVFSIYFKVNN